MPAGAARNALDCAFWDLEAKRAGRPVHALAGLPAPRPLVTAYTISLGTPDEMAAAAAKAAGAARSSRSSSARRAMPSGLPRCAGRRRTRS